LESVQLTEEVTWEAARERRAWQTGTARQMRAVTIDAGLNPAMIARLRQLAAAADTSWRNVSLVSRMGIAELEGLGSGG
jgi:hypothetical protein